jgi:hypothetical protein
MSQIVAPEDRTGSERFDFTGPSCLFGLGLQWLREMGGVHGFIR